MLIFWYVMDWIGCILFEQGLFPYELFVKLYNWNKVELQPFGLTNCGNRLVGAVPYSRKTNSKCYSSSVRRYEIVCDVQGLSASAQSPTN